VKITAIFKKYMASLLFTLSLLLVEAGLAILFPLLIGLAIDDAIQGSYQGAIQLGLLGLTVLIVGVGRRIFDSRFY